MTDTEAITVLQNRIRMCRKKWEPIIEDSIGVTYGGYRDHDSHCHKCMPIIAVLAKVAGEKEQHEN